MSYCSWKDRLYVMTVLMSDIGLDLESFIPAYSTLKLANRDGRWNAVAWPLLTLPSSSSTPTVCEVTVLDASLDRALDPEESLDRPQQRHGLGRAGVADRNERLRLAFFDELGGAIDARSLVLDAIARLAVHLDDVGGVHDGQPRVRGRPMRGEVLGERA